MTQRYARLAAALRAAVLEREGHSDPGLRTAVEAHAAARSGHTAPVEAEVPEPFVRYVDTVARHAHRVTDADLQELRETGCSEDVLFEITVSAALGAGLGRLQRAYAALNGDV
jgi:alkylhydroperoxidase family enzyme